MDDVKAIVCVIIKKIQVSMSQKPKKDWFIFVIT